MIRFQKEITELIGNNTNTRFKNMKKTVNASMLFKKQHMVTELYGADFEADELEEDELEAIKELLIDELAPTDDIPDFGYQDADFYNLQVPEEEGYKIEDEVPPQVAAGKPLPTPPPRKLPSQGISLAKSEDVVAPVANNPPAKALPVPPPRRSSSIPASIASKPMPTPPPSS